MVEEVRLGFERHRPVGTTENSPAFQRWVRGFSMISPVGTADRGLARPSLRDLGLLDPSPSVETLGNSHPSLRDEEGEILVALGVEIRGPVSAHLHQQHRDAPPADS